jgi:plastocyanin
LNVRSRGVAVLGALSVAASLPAAAQAATKVVDMGVPPASQKAFHKYQADVNDFFPHGVTIHVGDAVTFVPAGFHTVDLPAKGDDPLPFVTPHGPVSGASDAAANPFWFNGQQQLGFNPGLLEGVFGKKLAYNGSARIQSGLPIQDRPKPFTVRFGKAGSFTYFCNIHPGMTGVVKVVGKKKAVPSAKADAKALKAQVTRDLKVAKGLAATKVPAGTVDVGSAGPHGVEAYTFFPNTLTVPAGTTVRFTMTKGSFEAHTATTGPGNPMTAPGSYLGKLAASMEAPVFDPAVLYPSDAPGAPAQLTPSSHGNGFWNSGFIDSSNATPLPTNNAVTFAAAGTYQFYCLIHPFMHGTVVVK